MEHSNKSFFGRGVEMSARIIGITGPSGVGKTTIATVLGRRLKVRKVVTSTSRPPRPGECDGVDYNFYTRKEFLSRVKKGEFLENEEYSGYLYGTRHQDLDKALGSGELVLLVLEIKGIASIVREYPDAQTFFITAPKEELIRRINERDIPESKRQERIAKLNEDLEGMKSPFVKKVISNDKNELSTAIEKIYEMIVYRIGRSALQEEK